MCLILSWFGLATPGVVDRVESPLSGPHTESENRLPVVAGSAQRASLASTDTLFNDSVFIALLIRQRFQRSRITGAKLHSSGGALS